MYSVSVACVGIKFFSPIAIYIYIQRMKKLFKKEQRSSDVAAKKELVQVE